MVNLGLSNYQVREIFDLIWSEERIREIMNTDWAEYIALQKRQGSEINRVLQFLISLPAEEQKIDFLEQLSPKLLQCILVILARAMNTGEERIAYGY